MEPRAAAGIEDVRSRERPSARCALPPLPARFGALVRRLQGRRIRFKGYSRRSVRWPPDATSVSIWALYLSNAAPKDLG